MTEITTGVPNPGSPDAVAKGCRCAVLDNAHGRGFLYRGETDFWITASCPLHGTPRSDTSAAESKP